MFGALTAYSKKVYHIAYFVIPVKLVLECSYRGTGIL
jgi:hypothetical protein